MNISLNSLSDGDAVSGYCVLGDIKVCQTANGKKYIGGTVQTAYESLPFKYWEYGGPITSSDSGSLAYIEGKGNLYKEQMQIICSSLCLVDPSELSQDEMYEIVPHAPIVLEMRERYLYDMTESIRDRTLYTITKHMIEKHRDSFVKIPAALGVHHAFTNGLLMHTTDMLMAGEQICEVYKYKVDRDLLISGIILHDIGKTTEFEINASTGLVSEYSLKGNALGHGIIGVIEIGEVSEKLGCNRERTLLLQHLIASHHGKPEYGAAVKPIILEAELLHKIDSIDATVEIYDEKLSNVDMNSFSQYIRSLEKRIYKHNRGFVYGNRKDIPQDLLSTAPSIPSGLVSGPAYIA